MRKFIDNLFIGNKVVRYIWYIKVAENFGTRNGYKFARYAKPMIRIFEKSMISVDSMGFMELRE